MNIERIKIEGFRNIGHMELCPGAGANIICGDNAQGKTNIIEAVWLFSGARSFRGAKESELISFGGHIARVELDFFAKKRQQQAVIAYSDTAERKTVSLNGIKQSGASALAGEFCAVLFSPDHLSLIKQGPEYRRKMIDASLCQAYPKYAGILESYSRILKQRAGLLRDITRNSSLYDLLDVWDKSLIEYGAYIMYVRAGYIKKLSSFAEEIYAGISGGKGREKLDLEYKPEIHRKNIEGYERSDFMEAMAEAVKSARAEDIASGKTSVGPHRDDILVTLDGSSARSFGSQGQQRSCVLALKLAECGILEERNSESPVVLLDDVMSELDDSRRSYLLNKLENRQVIITCCDPSLFTSLKGGEVFHVNSGSLRAPPTNGK